ncbi:hypothetical protein H5U35_09835, partial [Candidatus Aerophobetes bacterium]|nr:hypothetical protein [Candidatus Aerophobetes bacterium]
IQATGYVPEMQVAYQVKRKVEVTLLREAGENTVFDMALFGGADTGRSITITGNTLIDSYNSEGQGKTYPNGKGNKGHIGTNSKSTSPEAVRIIGNSEINGTVYIGPEGDVNDAITVSGNVDLSGEPPADTFDTVRTLPEVIPPEIPPGLEDRGSLSHSGNSDYHVSGNGRYSSISLSGNGDLIFDSNVSFIYVEGNFKRTGNGDIIVNSDMVLYIGGNFEFTGNGELHVEGGHTLTVYVGGNITGTGNGIINTSQDPTKVLIFGLDTCSEVKITGNADLYGAVYARNAEIKVTGNGDVYGSLVGNKISISGNSDVHYDEALAYSQNVPGAPTYDARYVLRSWNER